MCDEVVILHVMDKVSVDGSKIHGPARQLSYRVQYYPKNFKIYLCNLREEDDACNILRSSGIEVISLGKSKYDLSTILLLNSIFKQVNPSIVHLHGYASWDFGRIVGKFRNIPIVVQEHFIDDNIPIFQKVFDYILRKHYDEAIAVSDAVKMFMSDKRFLNYESVRVFNNGVPLDKVNKKSKSDIEKLRKHIGIPPGEKVVGTVGRLAEMKGQTYFLKAAKKILQTRDDVNFVIIGDGPLMDNLVKESKQLQISEKVNFLGYRPDAVDLLSLFDVSVISSIYGEGTCSVGIESFAVETPLVATDLPGYKNIYRDKINCLKVPPENAEAMADAILSILNDAALRDSLILNGRKSLKLYSIEEISMNYIALYRRLADKWACSSGHRING